MGKQRRYDLDGDTEMSLDMDPKPEEKKPDPVAKVKEPEAKEPEPSAQAVPFRVFKVLSGLKPDKLRGFEHFVTKEKLGSLSMAAWQEKLAAFQSRPIVPLRRK